ncbi:putative Pilus assembly protein [Azospirillaceae bacterium]
MNRESPLPLRTLLRSAQHAEHGSTCVEFALGSMIVFLAIFGIIEFGRYLWTQHTVESACAEAARYIYTHSTDPLTALQTAIPSHIRKAMTGLDQEKLTVTTTTSATDGGVNFLSIQTSYPFQFASILMISAVTIKANSVIPVE